MVWTWVGKKWVIPTAYALVGLVLFIFFSYWTFPFASMESKLIARLEQESDCRLHVGEKKRIRFPLQVHWNGVMISCPGWAPWEIASLKVDVALLPLLRGRGHLHFQAQMSGGEVEGRFTAVKKAGQYEFSLKNEWKKLNLSSSGMTGLVSLQGEGVWQADQPLQGQGTLSFLLTGVEVSRLGSWASPVGPLVFSNIHGQVQWKGGVVKIENLSAQGRELDLNGEGGDLHLSKPLSQSEISLHLRATPKGTLQQFVAALGQSMGPGPLTLGVTGPLSRPRILFNGQAFSVS